MVVFLFARPLTAIFNSGADPTLQALAEPGMRLYFLACPFVGINVLLSVYFTSTEHPGPAQLLSLLYGFLVLLPMVFLLSAAGGVTGTWCAYPATHALVCVVGLLLFRRLHKKNIRKSPFPSRTIKPAKKAAHRCSPQPCAAFFSIKWSTKNSELQVFGPAKAAADRAVPAF